MTPAMVQFTGLEVETESLNRRLSRPIPAAWLRYQFNVEGHEYPDHKLSEWITNNLRGRWIATYCMDTAGFTVVLGFEDHKDAVMFRLLEGETAWLADTASVIEF